MPSLRCWLTLLALAVRRLFRYAVLSAALWMSSAHPGECAAVVPRSPGRVTFTQDIAPILFQHCAGCHRPGQPAPFSLLNYQEISKRAQQIVEVTQSRYMPPWLPEPGYGEFVGTRRLSQEQIGVIRQWMEEGSVEGNPKDLPPLPQFPDGWQLGPPDLVIQMPQAYTLGPEGRDVYRNFVIPIPLPGRRYVRGVEFHPGNWRIVHHAFLRIDRTRESRRLDEKEAEPGFPGIHTPISAQSPEGHFLSWQPGKVPSLAPEGFAWTLETNADLVLQLHLQPTGKPEPIQASIGFYFTDQPPRHTPFKVGLISLDIDIPSGAQDYIVRDSYRLPVDVEVLGLLPHAHFLGKELQATATLPDGTTQWLLRILHWDFNWQGDYRYAKPVFLPKGTVLSMNFIYDNSAENPRNPSHPPRPVSYGLQSTDEMAELWLLTLPRSSNDLAVLGKDYAPRVVRHTLAHHEYLLRLNPADAKAHAEVGKALLALGKRAPAREHLRVAVRIQDDYDEPHYHLGLMSFQEGKLSEAKMEFEKAVRLNEDNYKAHVNLGSLLLEEKDLNGAEKHFRKALQVNPADAFARYNLDLVLKAKGNP